MDDFVAVITTVATREDAERLTVLLLKKKLAACVQIDRITSFYRWQGLVETSEEQRLTIKTAPHLLPVLAEEIGLVHPYEVPELIALPLVFVAPAYRQWLEQELGETHHD